MNDRYLSRDLQARLDLFSADDRKFEEPEYRAFCDELAQLPDGHRLLEQHRRFERAMQESMHDVSVPPGLTARVITELQAARAASAPYRQSRRRWLQGGVAAAVAVAASLAIVALWPAQRVLDEADLQESHAWHAAIEASGWRSMQQEDLSQHFLPRQLNFVPARYAVATQAVGRTATAYELNLPNRPKATLFVIDQDEPIDIPFFAPNLPQHQTWGYMVAYWQNAKHVYVLVVESDNPSDFRRLINPSAAAELT